MEESEQGSLSADHGHMKHLFTHCSTATRAYMSHLQCGILIA